VIRAETLEDMFDIAALLGRQPLPRGRRTAIVTNSHGSGVLCADAAAAGGLVIATLSGAAREFLEERLPDSASSSPFIDLTAAARPEHYRAGVESALLDEAADAVIVLYTPVRGAQTDEVLQAIHEAAAAARASGEHGKPVIVVTLSGQDGGGISEKDGVSIPCYLFPEKAARVLAVAADYAAWRARPPGHTLDFEDAQTQRVRDICARALSERGEGWLSEAECADVLRAYGVPVLGGTGRPGPAEVMIGMTEDPLFGPVIGFGLSGVPSNLLHDIEFRVTPLTDDDARDMIRGIKGYPLLLGHGPHGPADIDGIAETLSRISLLIEETPEIREMELDPIATDERDGTCGVRGARIRVAAATRGQPARYVIAAAT
jgi:acyl-CoA synthetase (NDP forming)